MTCRRVLPLGVRWKQCLAHDSQAVPSPATTARQLLRTRSAHDSQKQTVKQQTIQPGMNGYTC
jgi:hypothetical protein